MTSAITAGAPAATFASIAAVSGAAAPAASGWAVAAGAHAKASNSSILAISRNIPGYPTAAATAIRRRP